MNYYESFRNKYWRQYLDCSEKLEKEKLKRIDLSLAYEINNEELKSFEKQLDNNETQLDKVKEIENNIFDAKDTCIKNMKNNTLISPLIGIVLAIISTITKAPITTQIYTFLISSVLIELISCGIDFTNYIVKSKKLEKELKKLNKEELLSENISLSKKLESSRRKTNESKKKLNITDDKIVSLNELLEYLLKCYRIVAKAETKARKKLKFNEAPEREYNRRFKNDDKIHYVMKLERKRNNKGIRKEDIK